jgi:lipopolysaccharide/colanic/teichoic acid biosynthesis glycosyltransferase
MENKVSILYIGVSPVMIDHFGSHNEVDFIVHRNLLAAKIYLKKNQKPDAILCDEYPSGGKGFDFHDELRQNPEFNEVAFILLSDEFRQNVYNLALSKKIDDFYILPDPSVAALIGRVRFLRDYRRKYSVKPPSFATDTMVKMPRSKRIFDLVVACSALVFLSPLLLLVILAIKLESKGSFYYKSPRFGQKKFDFYKLRSMRIGADNQLDKLAKEKNQYQAVQKQPDQTMLEPCPRCAKLPEGQFCSPVKDGGAFKICDYWFIKQSEAKQIATFTKISNDPRVTKVGKFIRNTSIDELPQLINVIKGDMSIVGNRPLPIYEVEHLLTDKVKEKDKDNENSSEDKKIAMMRCLAPAGITGLWQVELRGRGGDMSEEERKRYDVEYYTEHLIEGKYSFWYDLGLVLRTAKALFQKDSV